MTQGIVLFAHGSRDSGWSRPLEALAAEVRRRDPAAEVVLAFLEFMKPSLEEALGGLAARKVESVRIVPVFLATGGHLREDLPRLVARASAAHPSMHIVVDAPIGEQPGVIAAIAASISPPGGRSSP
ncbi:MAG TPA: CbiX/SirB N-terminal domain-containing protein [Burkholderiales bacterium]|nr:CbiX/SirB N-terminal domain-containing protein [Burkholderiales bacterium]